VLVARVIVTVMFVAVLALGEAAEQVSCNADINV